MAEFEQFTIALPVETAAVVRRAVAEGDYVSTSDVVHAALREWTVRRALQVKDLAVLKADIDKGLADVDAGRVKDFDTASIVARGRTLLADG